MSVQDTTRERPARSSCTDAITAWTKTNLCDVKDFWCYEHGMQQRKMKELARNMLDANMQDSSNKNEVTAHQSQAEGLITTFFKFFNILQMQ